jgi:hypothetical protein
MNSDNECLQLSKQQLQKCPGTYGVKSVIGQPLPPVLRRAGENLLTDSFSIDIHFNVLFFSVCNLIRRSMLKHLNDFSGHPVI